MYVAFIIVVLDFISIGTLNNCPIFNSTSNHCSIVSRYLLFKHGLFNMM